jgi:Outer membrane protein beta-barrel domain
MKKSSHFLAIGAIFVSAHAAAADGIWHERWIQGYLGENEDKLFPSSENGIEAMYEFNNQFFLHGVYHVSKEKSGGTDNNALYTYSTVIDAGYTFNLYPYTKIQLGYGYLDANAKNIQLGGSRIGNYRDQHIYGSGPMLRVIHKLTDKLTSDVMLARIKYTTDVTNTNSRIGLSYDIASNIYGRIEFNSVDRSNFSGTRWAAGIGYRF